MPRYVSLVKYTPESLASVRAAGYASRVDALRGAIESIGGKLEAVEFMSSGEWDLMIRAEAPSSEANFAMASMSWASGVAERFVTYEVFTAAEADAAIAASSISYTAPGE